MQLQPGDRIGDFQILDVLGAGGMGRVYKVQNVFSERIEAMKVLLPNLISDPELLDRFMREIKVQASLKHNNIAALYGATRIDNQLVMLMEYIEGETLEKYMSKGPVPLTRGLDYIMQVLSALAYAHQLGVVHRDIKPANMMLTPGGVVKLMDFGIARMKADRRLTQTGRTVGSLYYMSPEQINGGELDARSDLYSLGVSLYEVVTGRRPFQGDSDYSIMAAHLQSSPVPPIEVEPRLPQALNDIILMSISKDPSHRFQSADAFRAALNSVAQAFNSYAGAGSPYPVPPPSPQPGYTPPRPSPTAPTVAQPLPHATPHPPHQGQPAGHISNPQIQTPQAGPPPSAYASQPSPYAGTPAVLPPQKRSGRGLYMILGSAATVAVLVVAATQAPRFFRSTGAASTQQEAQTIPNNPPDPGAQTAESANPPANSAANAQAEPSQTDAQSATAQSGTAYQDPQASSSRPSSMGSSAQTQVTPSPGAANAGYANQSYANQVPNSVRQPDPPARPQVEPPVSGSVVTQQPNNSRYNIGGSSEAGALREARELLMILGTRANTVRGSIERLRREQSREGLGLRGDIATSVRRLEFYLDEAEGAIRSSEVSRAKSSLSSAERELEKLENFLGQ
jgi:eukaryotic-like serine/threonine-protein kinase